MLGKRGEGVKREESSELEKALQFQNVDVFNNNILHSRGKNL